MKTLVLLAAILLCRASVAADAEIPEHRAGVLAGYYWDRYFPEIGCGAPLPTGRRFHYWTFVVAVGYGGVPSGTIRVHRFTGETSYIGPLGARPRIAAGLLERWHRESKRRVSPKDVMERTPKAFASRLADRAALAFEMISTH